MRKDFDRVVIWGHKLLDARTANTFAFIHDSWFRTFKHMGYETLWLDNLDDISKINLENSLFLTEGQVDGNLPVLASCKYIIHNCDIKKYSPVLPSVLNLQVFTNDCLSRKVEVVDEQQLCYYQPEADFSRHDHCCDNRTIYQPWATNLLPTEFDVSINIALTTPRQKRIFWVGSIMGGPHRNDDKLSELAQAATKDGVSFIHAKLQNDMQPKAIAESWIAPAVQGAWQVEKGYVPCRVFKNLSFGRMTPTNSETVNTLFDNRLVYDKDVTAMYKKAVEWENSPDQETLDYLIEQVRTKHTFVNRIENLLKVL